MEIYWCCSSTIYKFQEILVTMEIHNNLIEFGMPRKLAGLIEMCLNETYGTVCIGKNLSDKFPIENDLKQEDVLSPLLFNCAFECAVGRVK
jgi:hypothetical protein